MLYTTVGILCALILLFFTLSGVAEFIKTIVLKFYDKQKINSYIIVKLTKDKQSNIEYMLRGLVAKIRWMKKNRPQKIICINYDLEETEKRICEIICSEYDFVELLDKEDFNHWLNKY